MKEKLTRFALWLGVIEYVYEETTEQKIDRLMRKMASDKTWDEYCNVRWGVLNVNKPARNQEGKTWAA